MKSKKQRYLENVEDTAVFTNSLIKSVSFLGVVGLGVLAICTGVVVPLIVSASVFGASAVDSIAGKLSDFKEKDVSPAFSTRGEERHHGVKETQTVPPLLYGLMALPSIFMSGKEQHSSNSTYTSESFNPMNAEIESENENEKEQTNNKEIKETLETSKDIDERAVDNKLDLSNNNNIEYDEEKEM